MLALIMPMRRRSPRSTSTNWCLRMLSIGYGVNHADADRREPSGSARSR